MLYKAHFLQIAQCALNNNDIQESNMKYTFIVLGFPREAFPIGLLHPVRNMAIEHPIFMQFSSVQEKCNHMASKITEVR